MLASLRTTGVTVSLYVADITAFSVHNENVNFLYFFYDGMQVGVQEILS